MTKITSFVQKVFGKDATNIGQVGSAAAGTKVLTTNPTTIQALTAFTNGISDVTISSKRIIPQEEFMALHYLHSWQNAYQQQEGIQEYNSGVTYYQKSIVKKAGTYEIYGSLVDDNIGNALTDGTKWVLLQDLSTPASFIPDKLSTASGSAPSYSARAWVNFIGTGTVSINASGNVSSITDNGTGDYTVNFTTAMPNANYCVSTTVQRTTATLGNSGLNYGSSSTLTTSSFRVLTTNAAATTLEDMAVIHAIVFV